MGIGSKHVGMPTMSRYRQNAEDCEKLAANVRDSTERQILKGCEPVPAARQSQERSEFLRRPTEQAVGAQAGLVLLLLRLLLLLLLTVRCLYKLNVLCRHLHERRGGGVI